MRLKYVQYMIDLLRGKKKITLLGGGQKALYIEVSGCCNAKCKYCCTGSKNHITKTKFMSAEVFEKIIRHLKKQKLIPENKLVALYNWGEPFLNPEFNEILSILGKYELKACISSNFIKFPDIEPKNYKNISYCTFSICSFDKEKYKYIYGADLDKVLENFNKFLELKNKYNPNMSMSANWLIYKFNGEEKDFAENYFQQRNVSVAQNYYAYVNDGYDTINYVTKGILENYDLNQAKNDLCMERMTEILKLAPNKKFDCPMKKDYILINESGELSLCCCVTSKNKEYYLGNILDMNKKEIMKIKTSQNHCKICEKLNLPWFAFVGNSLSNKS